MLVGYTVRKSENSNDQFIMIDVINNLLLSLDYSIKSVIDFDFNQNNMILSISIINSNSENEISIWEMTVTNRISANP
jgi:hypothetical protein